MGNAEFMAKALDLAKIAFDEGEVPVGAIIVKDDLIIAQAYNSCEKSKNAIAHAEILAIEQASKALNNWRLCDCTLYVTLEPCSMCAGAIINSRVSKVIFGAYNDNTGSCGSVFNLFDEKLGHHPELIGGYMQKPCQDLLTEFFRGKRE